MNNFKLAAFDQPRACQSCIQEALMRQIQVILVRLCTSFHLASQRSGQTMLFLNQKMNQTLEVPCVGCDKVSPKTKRKVQAACQG